MYVRLRWWERITAFAVRQKRGRVSSHRNHSWYDDGVSDSTRGAQWMCLSFAAVVVQHLYRRSLNAENCIQSHWQSQTLYMHIGDVRIKKLDAAALTSGLGAGPSAKSTADPTRMRYFCQATYWLRQPQIVVQIRTQDHKLGFLDRRNARKQFIYGLEYCRILR